VESNLRGGRGPNFGENRGWRTAAGTGEVGGREGEKREEEKREEKEEEERFTRLKLPISRANSSGVIESR
jgi:hypothetical protein